MDTDRLREDLLQRLRDGVEAGRAEREKAYHKSSLEHWGVPMPVLRKAVSALKKDAKGLGHDDLVALVGALWDSGVFEQRMAAVVLMGKLHRLLGPDDVDTLEAILRDCGGWALVDTLSTAVLGPMVERHDLGGTLDRWSTDDDSWVRRASMLVLLEPLRRGEGDWERFTRYADAMLEEKEFFIRKAIGWILRATARKRPDMVYAWFLPRAGRASGVTMREVVKRLSPEQAEAVRAAHRG